MSRRKASPSLIPAEIREAAAEAYAADESRRRGILKRAERKQRCTDAVHAFLRAEEPLWYAPPDKTGPLLSAVHATLLDACKALAGAGRMDAWGEIDHEQTYAGYRQRGTRIMSQESYDWACRLFDRAVAGELPLGLLTETWDAPELRDSLRWLRIFLDGLSGEGAALPTKTEQQIMAQRFSLELWAGGFILRAGNAEHRANLSAKPLAVLRSLLTARQHVRTAAELLDEIWGGGIAGEQNVKDVVSKLRKAIAKAHHQVGLGTLQHDPIPCVAKGKDLAWELKTAPTQ
jgi:hypothetical protein